MYEKCENVITVVISSKAAEGIVHLDEKVVYVLCQKFLQFL